jgi:hypothetical protein
VVATASLMRVQGCQVNQSTDQVFQIYLPL